MSDGSAEKLLSTSRYVRILHISDLHRAPQAPTSNTALIGNLCNDVRYTYPKDNARLEPTEPPLGAPDLVVISGDLSQRADEEEFDVALEFLERLLPLVDGDRGRVVLVPGNHDVNWNLAARSYTQATEKEFRIQPPDGQSWLRSIKKAPDGTYWRRNNVAYADRFKPFKDFFDAFYQGLYTYSLQRDRMFTIYDLSKSLGLVVVGFNSCAEIDAYQYRGKLSSLDRRAFIPVDVAYNVDSDPSFHAGEKGLLHIAVFHHNIRAVEWKEDFLDPRYLQALKRQGFDLCLHGHVHDASNDLFDATASQVLPVAGAGSLAALYTHRPPAAPMGYNLVVIDRQLDGVWVHTRRHDGRNLIWAADYRWAGNPYFEVRSPHQIIEPPEPTRLPKDGDFVGREKELAYFKEKLETSHLAVITGLAGVGKSALARELVQQVAIPEKTFLHTFREPDGVSRAINKLIEFLFYDGQEDLWRMVEGIRQRDEQPLDDSQLLDYLLPMLRGRGYLLCLDDLHAAEHDALLPVLIEQLFELSTAGELSLIVASRHMPTPNLPIKFESISGLDAEDTNLLLTNSGLFLSDDDRAKLYERTKGNAQLLKLAIGALRRSDDLTSEIVRLVETEEVEDYLMEIDAKFTEDERKVMEAVSVLLGYPSSRDAIEAVLGKGRIQRILNGLSKDFLIKTRSKGRREYEQHDLVRAFYYELPGERERRPMHLRAGEYYETEERDTLKAARHFERAKDYPRAVKLVTSDVWTQISQGQAQALRQLLERFEVQQLDTAEWTAVNIARGEVYSFLRESQLAQRSYEEAYAELGKLPESPVVHENRVRVCRGVGTLLEHEDSDRALEWLEKGLDQLVGVSALEEGALQLRMGSVLIGKGEFSEASKALERSLYLLEPEGPSQWLASVLTEIGVIQCIQGDLEQGEEYYRRALQMCQQIHAHWAAIGLSKNLGMVREFRGDWAAAAGEYRESLKLAERLGSVTRQVEVGLSLGVLCTKRGDVGEAEAHLLKCIELAQKHDLREQQIRSQSSLADLYIRLERWAKAEALVKDAEQLALEIDVKWTLSEIYSCWAHIQLAGGQIQTALDYAHRSVKLARDLGQKPEDGVSLRVLGQVQFAKQQKKEAMMAFENGLSLSADYDSYEAARTRMKWGTSLIVEGDVEQGIALLGEARAAFHKLGARRDEAAVQALLSGRDQNS